MAKTTRKSNVGTARKIKEKTHINCVKCGSKIPETKRSDAKFCSERCKDTAEKARYCAKNPDYVKRQRKIVAELQQNPDYVAAQRRKSAEARHKKLHGHLDYLNNPTKNKKDRFWPARLLGFRSMLEAKTSEKLKEKGVEFGYETLKIKYVVPQKICTYTPDITLSNGIILELKGRLTLADRKKHLLIQKQRPDLDIRFVFSNSKAKINKGSKTSYADWCNQNGFMFSDKEIPEEWLTS